ncbi:MAG TPA: ABC transporter [Verrucomicrobia bacterium]|nr:ABC transporter [Verrucomicrobiales bacterium]HIL56262.1 ABC transporter [Verrucomicrobiota bacterium]
MLVLSVAVNEAAAARIGEIVETNPWDQMRRFITLSDRGLRLSLIGALLFGAVCGLLGSFIVVRKMALFGDAISHAVLPGVALGFLWSMSKDPVAILIGATLAGLAGSLLVGAIRRTTRIKQDAALGIVLASFFAIGLCLIRIIQNNEGASKITGLKSYLFGDVAVLDRYDVITMGVVVILTVILFGLLYRPFLAISFDRQFAVSIGFPVRILEALFQMFLAFAIVISLQAVGVVLVSAMLITPAATAYLLVDRMHRMLWIAMGVGMLSAVIGVFLSFLGSNLPTGPFMVLSASSIFTMAYLFSPKYGRFTKWLRHRARVKKVREENSLKSIYKVLESKGLESSGNRVLMKDLSSHRKMSIAGLVKEIKNMQRSGLVKLEGDNVSLTDDGFDKARSVVRNHRLWELYLTNEANYALDHVHDDAEKVEHFLSEEEVSELESYLDYPQEDPHGKPIPGRASI